MLALVQLFAYDFVRNAYLTGTFIALMTACVGYFVVLRAQAFAGEALADIGFAGAAGATVAGASALVGMLFLSLLAALGIGALGDRLRGRDVEIGMVLAFALGLGVLFLTIYSQFGGDATAGVNVLFGSILSVTQTDVLISLITGAVVLFLLTLLFRPLLFASIDPEGAQARGVPVRLLSVIFLLLLGVATSEAVLAIGVLLVLALLIAPAAAAINLTSRPATSLTLAMVLGLLITWGGLTMAFLGTGRHLPIGFLISALAALVYLLSLALRHLRTRNRVRPPLNSFCDCDHSQG